jgi:ElaB/YqjD/DUF883 family membrane-anchored ribosome-binding protein
LRRIVGVYTDGMSENDLPAQAADLKSHAQDVIDKAGDQLSEHVYHLRDFASDARYHSEDFIQTNPWAAVILAASFGFVVGAIVARR